MVLKTVFVYGSPSKFLFWGWKDKLTRIIEGLFYLVIYQRRNHSDPESSEVRIVPGTEKRKPKLEKRKRLVNVNQKGTHTVKVNSENLRIGHL